MSDLLKAATPRPWKVATPVFTHKAKYTHIIGPDHQTQVVGKFTQKQKANAELIVKTVNSYEPMLEALEASLEELHDAHSHCNLETSNDGAAVAYRQVRSAIVLAKAEASQ